MKQLKKIERTTKNEDVIKKSRGMAYTGTGIWFHQRRIIRNGAGRCSDYKYRKQLHAAENWLSAHPNDASHLVQREVLLEIIRDLEAL